VAATGLNPLAQVAVSGDVSCAGLEAESFEAHWLTTVAGYYQLDVTFRGADIAGSPLASIAVYAAEPAAANCRAAWPATAWAGRNASFGIVVHDTYGNEVPCEQLDLSEWALTLAATEQPIVWGAFACVPLSEWAGPSPTGPVLVGTSRLNATFIAPVPGSWAMTLTLRGVRIAESGAVVTVSGPPRCRVRARG